ncbi:hypothetical protein Leryth_001922 [Lithospermum erythrorhizon]|nr:hypothetical protein Leryth_001922 [Lithospermum erythrorhizon]
MIIYLLSMYSCMSPHFLTGDPGTSVTLIPSLPLIIFLGTSTTSLSDDPLTPLNDDVLGLIVFKTSVNDPFSYLNSWSEDDNSPCSWNYIKCNPVSGRVQELTLDSLGLSGKIGKFLEKLEFLKVLSLSNNNFTGNISPGLANIKGLETLNLSRNSFSGNVPTTFSGMQSLHFLDLAENALSGTLPDNMFGDCLSLRYLSLAGNLIDGIVPSSLSKCTVINHLNLSNNHFTGNPTFSALERLRTVDLSNNMLSGLLPVGISALHNLKVLMLKRNRFSGMIPYDIGYCPHLNRIDFSDNLFNGVVPDSIQMLKSLTYLDLSNNLLGGNFPVWIGKLSSLEFLDFSGNGLEGSLPVSIGDLKSMNYLSLAHNKLNGNIPESLVECTSLTVIRLRGNYFSGRIPGRLFELGLDEVDFARNDLSGSIPSLSGKLSNSIQVLDLSENKLSGDIPAEMGLYSRMRYLNLSWNNLQSRLPPEFGYFQNISVLDLRNSSLTGPIPADICHSGNLTILQLDGNSLAGSIPDEIGNCSSLYMLSLSYNQLTGSIPKSMANLKKLKILKLEFNQLSGEIPPELSKLENLLAVNISYNRLIGRLPAGNIFQTLDASSLEGNSGLCSPRLKGPCKMDVPKPLVLNPHAYGYQDGNQDRGYDESPKSSMDHHKVLSVTAILAISAAAVIVSGVILVSFLNASARRRLAFIDNALESMCSSSSRSGGPATGKLILLDSRNSPEWSNMSFESILNKATEIGEGIFGTVYKAPIGEDGGRVMAIKRLVSSKIMQHPEEFDTEVRILGKARHPNLVALRGYYWTPQLQLLVSEFAPEGCVQARLHDRPPYTPPLSWPARLNIVLGTAKGLAHLHHSTRPPIIHYNIKPSNILLDENLNPKISDFGLVRLLTKLDKHAVNSRLQSSVGYLAPELACQTLRVNEKCDVFGFGVLILELITGRRPIEYREDNVLILNEIVRDLVEQGNALECVDPEMGGYPEEEILPILKLALVCTSQIPSSRPSMAEVVQIMQVIKTPVPRRM